MTATEKIVESYFRLYKKCFTLPDVKIVEGNNRQIDLLAYCVAQGDQYHIEVSVTHCENWCPDATELKDNFDKKFFGFVPKRVGKNTDYSKRKTYKKNIYDTYKKYGLNPNKIQRIWVCWLLVDQANVQRELNKYYRKRKIQNNPIKIISFRDTIIPDLLKKVSTSNYEDDSLRFLSLLRQYEKQTKPRKFREQLQ